MNKGKTLEKVREIGRSKGKLEKKLNRLVITFEI